MFKKKIPFFGFFQRFIIVHVSSYLVFEILFMYIGNYFDYFSHNQLLNSTMRQSDSPIVRLAVVLQLLRGGLLVSALYLFRATIIGRNGWLKLFVLLWVLTGIGSVITGPGSIEGDVG